MSETKNTQESAGSPGAARSAGGTVIEDLQELRSDLRELAERNEGLWRYFFNRVDRILRESPNASPSAIERIRELEHGLRLLREGMTAAANPNIVDFIDTLIPPNASSSATPNPEASHGS